MESRLTRWSPRFPSIDSKEARRARVGTKQEERAETMLRMDKKAQDKMKGTGIGDFFGQGYQQIRTNVQTKFTSTSTHK